MTVRLKLLLGSVLDAVKLDRTLMERVGHEPEAEAFARSLIGAARSFTLQILAEGVERAEQARFLVANGCHLVQGFLFGRPARKGELGAIVARDLRKAVEGEIQPSAHSSTAAA